MGGEDNWSIGAKSCDSCKSAPATLFCRADSAFLCMACDGKIHAANKLASRHARVWMCEVCEQAPASVTCKADAAALCVTCDRDIHSANPLARRHERFPVIPFYDSAAADKSATVHGRDERYFSDPEVEEEAEAASWLLPNPNPNKNFNKMNSENCPDLKTADYLFNDMDSYLDIDIMTADQKPLHQQNYSSGNADGVVPVQSKICYQTQPQTQPALVDGFPAYELDYTGSKPFMYNFTSQSISQNVSSSSLEVDLVPDHNAMADISNNTMGQHASSETLPNPISGLDREARVLRYREKRKNRKFGKQFDTLQGRRTLRLDLESKVGLLSVQRLMSRL